jgi:hypothetical protein
MNKKMHIIKDLLRKIRAGLSFPFNNKEKFYNAKDKIIIDKIYKIANKIKNKNQKKLNTHKIFSSKILNLILKKKLLNFLQFGFIQQMFFIHNRFFLILELIQLYKDKNWVIWKKIIKEDNIGNPVKFFLYPYSSGNKIHQAYHLKKFTQLSEIHLNKFTNVIEFGGGYGNMAKMFFKINKNISYTIFDTMEVNLLQYYYLKKSNLNVALGINKHSKINLLNKTSDLNKKLKLLKNNDKNLLIANWSLSEVPLKFRKELFFMFEKIDYQIISYQKKFEKIDNQKYFEKINLYNNKKNRKSQIINITNKPQNFYLFSYH